ncbi:MAG: bifunctional folylpolyglutamate synthase/dihydrofolate synthase [Bacteroidota bacterium]|nr:bifunctional folylpolyglutamate synthase/dihydrofolate synthase [Bacteroidota bacterium]
MTYSETLEYLYSRLPMFTRIGAAAFKKDLTNTIELCRVLNNPEQKFKSIHVAGTNGKGSVSHFLASILQEAGYKTGLYTSPHLLDFRERIRVNGEMIAEQEVVKFVEGIKPVIEAIEPSFFEVTVALAFDHFSKEQVDYAVIETGLGGRLDSTNVIRPVLSIITNVSFDHQNMLGETLGEIAFEKAGIIKPCVPVVIGKAHTETSGVFIKQAKASYSNLSFADSEVKLERHEIENGNLNAELTTGDKIYQLSSPLAGLYQIENLKTVVKAIEVLRTSGIKIDDEHVRRGITKVRENTALMGRWQIIDKNPLTICDVAHNEAGLKAVFAQVNSLEYDKLRIVYGMVRDKDIAKALSLLPVHAHYYFCAPDIPRALHVEELSANAARAGLRGDGYSHVETAYKAALADSSKRDIVLIVGSIFVVAEVLAIVPDSVN